MIYVFDTSALVHLFRYYYRSRFPSLWDRFTIAVDSRGVISVREVLQEVNQGDDLLTEWATKHRGFFEAPDIAELEFVVRIFRVAHFQSLVRNQERLEGRPVADPFVVAKAKAHDGCVVTQEVRKPNGSRIPNVCEHFGVACCDIEGFMEQENWTF